MDLDELSDEAKKENIISMVANMSKIDGEIHPNELVYLIQLGWSMGISEEKVRDIIIESDNFLFVPRSEMERMTILYHLILFMKIDGKIERQEEVMLHKVGLKLGFDPLMVENIIRVLKAHLGKKLPKDAILNEVKKSLN